MFHQYSNHIQSENRKTENRKNQRYSGLNRLPEIMKNGDAGIFPDYYSLKVPRVSNVVSARWVFTWKVDKAGCIIKPKGRLVARGFSQVHTVGFMETYSPTKEALCV